MMGATLDQIPGWSIDLSWAAEIGDTAWAIRNLDSNLIRTVKKRLTKRAVWMATHVHEYELCRLLTVHDKLWETFTEVLTIIAPESPRHFEDALCRLHNAGVRFSIWSPQLENCFLVDDNVDILLVDPRRSEHVLLLSHLTGIVFVGCSLINGMKGRSVAQACIANCAVVVGKHNEEYSQMTEEINQNAIIAAEEAENVVYHSAVVHHSEEFEEHEQDTHPRPLNGMLQQLSLRRSSSPFSFVTDILMSSFPYPANTERPQTAPPSIRDDSTREHGGRQLRMQQSSPTWNGRPLTAEAGTYRPHQLHDVLDEEENPRNYSRSSYPGEPIHRTDSGRRGDLSVFQINEEHYDTEASGLLRETTPDVADLLHGSEGEVVAEDNVIGELEWNVHRPSPISDAGIQTEQYVTAEEALYTDSKSCSPTNTARPHYNEGSDIRSELRVMSPTGDYVLPATHLPYGSTGPAIWTVQNEDELTDVLRTLLSDHLQARSRAHAASQGAARFAIGLVLEVWKVVFDHVVEEVVRNN